MTGVHIVQFFKEGEMVEERRIEAYDFLTTDFPSDLPGYLYTFLLDAARGDRITIETELPE